MRATVAPSADAASSMATSALCELSALAPGASSRPTPLSGCALDNGRARSRPHRQQHPLGLGQLQDARPRLLSLATVVGMGVADKVAEALVDLAARRLD